ncbi:MAG: hypothetical protein HY741_21890 [Chloroflexi bacterium]|nr:hypothetical protein [Chloroflexota bacterium]
MRLHADGHLAGLRDALKILEQAESSPQPDAAPEAARAPALAIAEERSSYDATSEPASAASSESAPPTAVQTTEE